MTKDAEHIGAYAPSAASCAAANAQGAGAGAAASAANSTEQYDHRFDQFARRIGASMMEAIRVTLSVFGTPDKDRWPMSKLLAYVKGAEELAREMLREIAESIFVYPAKAQVSVKAVATTPRTSEMRAPYFRLGVARDVEDQDSPICHPGREATRDPASQGEDSDILDPGSAPAHAARGLGRDDNSETESLFSRRIAALEDVLAHPGKHAARMARAIYRAAHEARGRLTLKTGEDLLLDRMNLMIAAHERGDAEAFARLDCLMRESWEPG